MEDRTILARHTISVDLEVEQNGINVKVSLTDRGSKGDEYVNRQVVQRYLSSRDPGTFITGLIGTVIEGVTVALDLSTDTLFEGLVRPPHDDWGVKVAEDGGMAGAKIVTEAKIVTPLEPRDFDPPESE